MTFRSSISILMAILAGTVLYIFVVLYLNKARVVNIADWNSGTRTLQVAAPMPSCACLSLRARDRGLQQRAAHLWDRLTTFRFGSDPLPDTANIALVARMSRSGTPVGGVALGTNDKASTWSFAFDWAGAMIDSRYEIQAFDASRVGIKVQPNGTRRTTVDASAQPLDMNALFWMDAVPQHSCSDTELNECPWGDLHLNQASGETVGQNAVESTFTGVRMTRDNRVLEAQATGKYRGAPGDCGCMFLEVLKPGTLTAELRGAPLGRVTAGQAGEFLSIPFDFAGPRGDDFYELRVNAGESIPDYFRLLGELDGMDCQSDAARFTMVPPSLLAAMKRTAAAPGLMSAQDAAAAVAGYQQILSCPYEFADPEAKIEGGMNLMQATNAFKAVFNAGPAPAPAPQAARAGSAPPAAPAPSRGRR